MQAVNIIYYTVVTDSICLIKGNLWPEMVDVFLSHFHYNTWTDFLLVCKRVHTRYPI